MPTSCAATGEAISATCDQVTFGPPSWDPENEPLSETGTSGCFDVVKDFHWVDASMAIVSRAANRVYDKAGTGVLLARRAKYPSLYTHKAMLTAAEVNSCEAVHEAAHPSADLPAVQRESSRLAVAKVPK